MPNLVGAAPRHANNGQPDGTIPVRSAFSNRRAARACRLAHEATKTRSHEVTKRPPSPRPPTTNFVSSSLRGESAAPWRAVRRLRTQAGGMNAAPYGSLRSTAPSRTGSTAQHVWVDPSAVELFRPLRASASPVDSQASFASDAASSFGRSTITSWPQGIFSRVQPGLPS